MLRSGSPSIELWAGTAAMPTLQELHTMAGVNKLPCQGTGRSIAGLSDGAETLKKSSYTFIGGMIPTRPHRDANRERGASVHNTVRRWPGVSLNDRCSAILSPRSRCRQVVRRRYRFLTRRSGASGTCARSWLVIIGTAIIAYIQNSRTFVATRFLLAVVAIDASRTPRVNEKRVGSFPGVPKMAV